MATVDPEALEYVETLASTPLAWMAQAILDRIACLPELPRDTADGRVADAERQLDEVRDAAFHAAKRELGWTDALEELRLRFDLGAVLVEQPDGGAVPLTGPGHREAVDRFAATLARELEQSRVAVRRREGLAG